MEIERKFTIKRLPEHLEQYESRHIRQGYLCTGPVVRIRRWEDTYFLTYKAKRKLQNAEAATARSCEEVELPLTKEAYEHLRKKVDGHLIKKTRYLIPQDHARNIELDVFEGLLKGLVFAEVEFGSEEEAAAYRMPEWFLADVTFDKRYGNSYLSKINSLDELGFSDGELFL